MQTTNVPASGLILRQVLRAQDLVALLGRPEEDALMFAFARWAEAKLRRWVDFANGALLFLMAPGDPESGMFYIYDRATGSFWMADIAESRCWGGYREEEFDRISHTYGLRALAQNPRRRALAA